MKGSICIGTGNEGNSGRHKQGKIAAKTENILFNIAPFEQNLNLQIWKDFVDTFQMVLISPSGTRHEITDQQGKITVYVWKYDSFCIQWLSDTI